MSETRHFWYSAGQHRMLRAMSEWPTFSGKPEPKFVRRLPDGRVSTENNRERKPSGKWPDYVYLGKFDAYVGRVVRADTVPSPLERKKPAPGRPRAGGRG